MAIDPGGNTPPPMALRTYRFLRLGAIAVIAILAVSVIKEYHRAGDCLQGSISAYYYTVVQSVFVGALVALGLVMVALWGKSPFEDSFLNLAGMLAPVVAFVPTSDTNKCGLADVTGGKVTTEAEKADVIEASHGAVVNNMQTYLIVIGVFLAALLVVGIIARVAGKFSTITENPVAFWIPWGAATVLWLFGFYKFTPGQRDWFYDNAHELSATVMFILIGLAVVDIGIQKWRGRAYLRKDRYIRDDASPGWAWRYWILAALMLVGGLVIRIWGDKFGDNFAKHQTFWLEAWEIALLALFWILQTWDRWWDGAPRPQM